MKKLIILALAMLIVSTAASYEIDVHVSGYEYENSSGEVLARFGSNAWGCCDDPYSGNHTYPVTNAPYWGSPQTVTGQVNIGYSLHFSNTGTCNAPQISHVYITIPNPFNQPEEEDPTIPPNQ